MPTRKAHPPSPVLLLVTFQMGACVFAQGGALNHDYPT
jgi:hypothetical protein